VPRYDLDRFIEQFCLLNVAVNSPGHIVIPGFLVAVCQLNYDFMPSLSGRCTYCMYEEKERSKTRACLKRMEKVAYRACTQLGTHVKTCEKWWNNS
jgi:hypothetical protein